MQSGLLSSLFYYPFGDTMRKQAKQAWTIQQTAVFLQISPGALYRIVARGELPALRLGRRLRFDPDLVRARLRGVDEQAPAA
jgi:excisionase family DNA binding protein